MRETKRLSVKKTSQLIDQAKGKYGAETFIAATRAIEKHTKLEQADVLELAARVIEIFELQKRLGKQALRHIVTELLSPSDDSPVALRHPTPPRLTMDEIEIAINRYQQLRMNIACLNLGPWITNPLKKAGINTVAELAQRRSWDLLTIQQIGRESVKTIERALDELGLYLGMELDRVIYVDRPKPVAAQT